MTDSLQMTPGGGGYGPVGEKRQVGRREDHEKWKKGSVANRIAEWESSS